MTCDQCVQITRLSIIDLEICINIICSPFLYSTTAASIMSAKMDTIMTAEIDPINIAFLFISESSVKSMGPVSIKKDCLLLLHNAIQLL